MGLIKLVCETYSLLNVDRIGRRPLLMIGSLGLTASLLAIGASMQIKIAAGTPGVTAASIGVFAGIVGYMAFHALSYGPCAARRRARPRATATPLPRPQAWRVPSSAELAGSRHTPYTALHRLTPPYTALHRLTPLHRITWLVLAEIFPSNIRGKAMGIATMVNRGTSFVVAYTFLTMCERLEWSGTFYLYAAFAGERAARRGVGIIVARPRARAAQRAPAARLVRTLRATLRSPPPCLLAAASFVFYGLFVPETAGVRLEEIAPLFGDPKALVRRNLGSLRAMVGRSKC